MVFAAMSMDEVKGLVKQTDENGHYVQSKCVYRPDKYNDNMLALNLYEWSMIDGC